MSDAELEKTETPPVDAGDVGDSQGPASVPLTDPATLAEELEAANNRVLRAQAELENFRKRTRRELDDQRRYANSPLIGDLLPVLDNLSRAVEATDPTDSASGLLEGVKMVSAQMLAVLQQHGCQEIEAEGVAFDPNLHEAIGKVPSAEIPEGNVIQVTRVGYQLHDRVVRPPQVLISGGRPSSEGAADGASDQPFGE